MGTASIPWCTRYHSAFATENSFLNDTGREMAMYQTRLNNEVYPITLTVLGYAILLSRHGVCDVFLDFLVNYRVKAPNKAGIV